MPFSRDARDVATTAAATLLLAAFWWLAVSASLSKSHTSDELPHLTAGYAFDRFGDFRMHPENGILPQRLFGLAPLADQARFPLDELRWRHSTYWQLGWDFFYALGNPIDWYVLAARSLNALFGVVLGLFIFLVARAWRGRLGGLVALAFFAFSPNFLAHAGLATSDLAAATMLTLAPWFFWRHLERRDLASGLLAGAISGLTLVAKFNGVLLAPIFALLAGADAWLRVQPGAGRRGRFLANLGLAAGQGAAAVLTIWAFFNFRFSARGAGTPELVQFAWAWPEMMAALGAKRVVIETALRAHLLPEAWLYGLTNVLAGEAARPSFFAGEHSLRGWWQFFPTLFLVKTPLPLLLALLLAAAGLGLAAVRAPADRRREGLKRAVPLLVGAGVVWGAALTSHLNIGDRHILPVYPVLFVATASLTRPRGLALVAAALVAAQGWASLTLRPHFLAGFNSLAGGPAAAYRLFVDSSLDWGQDLPALRDWLTRERRPGEKLYLGYFGSAWPPHYDVRPNQFLPTPTYLVSPPLFPYDYEPGLFAVSATVLSEVYSPFRGPWTAAHEASYQALRARRQASAELDFAAYDRLRFARLCKFLQARRPDAAPGHSILIFRLSAAELAAALAGPPPVGSHRLRMP